MRKKKLYIFNGHTHTPASFKIMNTNIINFGAIGYSFNKNTDAQYGIVDFANDVIIEKHSIPYDIERYKTDIKAPKDPFKENLLYALEHGSPLPMKKNLQ